MHVTYVLCLFFNKTFFTKMKKADFEGSDFLQH